MKTNPLNAVPPMDVTDGHAANSLPNVPVGTQGAATEDALHFRRFMKDEAGPGPTVAPGNAAQSGSGVPLPSPLTRPIANRPAPEAGSASPAALGAGSGGESVNGVGTTPLLAGALLPSAAPAAGAPHLEAAGVSGESTNTRAGVPAGAVPPVAVNTRLQGGQAATVQIAPVEPRIRASGPLSLLYAPASLPPAQPHARQQDAWAPQGFTLAAALDAGGDLGSLGRSILKRLSAVDNPYVSAEDASVAFSDKVFMSDWKEDPRRTGYYKLDAVQAALNVNSSDPALRAAAKSAGARIPAIDLPAPTPDVPRGAYIPPEANLSAVPRFERTNPELPKEQTDATPEFPVSATAAATPDNTAGPARGTETERAGTSAPAPGAATDAAPAAPNAGLRLPATALSPAEMKAYIHRRKVLGLDGGLPGHPAGAGTISEATRANAPAEKDIVIEAAAGAAAQAGLVLSMRSIPAMAPATPQAVPVGTIEAGTVAASPLSTAEAPATPAQLPSAHTIGVAARDASFPAGAESGPPAGRSGSRVDPSVVPEAPHPPNAAISARSTTDIAGGARTPLSTVAEPARGAAPTPNLTPESGPFNEHAAVRVPAESTHLPPDVAEPGWALTTEQQTELDLAPASVNATDMPGAPPAPVRLERELRVVEVQVAEIHAQAQRLVEVNTPESLPLEVLKAL